MSSEVTPDLTELEELLKAITTRGPFSAESHYLIGYPASHSRPNGEVIGDMKPSSFGIIDLKEQCNLMQLVAAALNALPSLLAIARRVGKLEAALKEIAKPMSTYLDWTGELQRIARAALSEGT